MTTINWEEANEDATHYDTNADLFCNKDGWWAHDGKFHSSANREWGTPRYVARQTELDGEGWPPIGWHGQVTWGTKNAWYECVSVSIGAFAVGTINDNNLSIEYLKETDSPEFKPLPTKAEQCREAAINKALAIDCPPQDGILSRLDFCARLYDAGMLVKGDKK